MAVSSFFGKFFGRTISEGAAFAIGVATGPALGPIVQDVVNEARSLHRVYPLAVMDAAQLVAQGIYQPNEGDTVASHHGIDAQPFAALVRLAEVAPELTLALQLWRRGAISEALMDHALEKAKIEPDYRAPLKTLFTERLDPAVIATAIQRGIMHDPGFLPVGPPSGAGKVPAFPVSPLDSLTEAAASGIDEERLFVETAIVGLPMSLQQAASAYFRQIIELTDYHRAVSEGNTRNEWRDAILEQSRQITTAHEGIEARLRGWIDDAGMYAETARHGMSKADTDLLFKVLGRPPSWHQIWIGLQRGGVYDGPTTGIDPAFLKGLQESNLRPEWYNLLWHSRYNYPSPFVLRQLTTSGAITQADAEQVLHFEGYEPTFAAKIAAAWATGPGAAVKAETPAQLKSEHEGWRLDAGQLAAALVGLGYPQAVADRIALISDDAVVHKYVGKVMDKVYKGYVGGAKTEAQARQALAGLRVAPEAIGSLITVWNLERSYEA